MTATYVYGLIDAGTELPADLTGLGPSGKVTTVAHGDVAAIVGDVPDDRPLGTRDDLLAHESVVDTVASVATVLPMRFPAVIREEDVVPELLAPHHDHFVAALEALAGTVQYTLKGSYVQEVALREVLAARPEIRQLQDHVRELPEDASYYERVRLGEMVVEALEHLRDDESARLVERLQGVVLDTRDRQPPNPDDLVDVAFLVARDGQQPFVDAVEELGRELDGRARLRLLGPLAPYDFVPAEDEG